MALVRSSAQAYTAAGATVTITTPTGAASGDVLVAMVWCDIASATISAVAGGWTLAQEGNDGGGTPVMRGALFHRTLVAAPDANYAFTNADNIGNIMGVMWAVNPAGDTLGTILTSLQGTTGSATGTTASLTLPAAPSILLCGFGVDDNLTVTTAPVGMTVDQAIVDGSGMDAAAYSLVDPAAGATTKSIVWSGSTEHVALAISIAFSSASVVGPVLTPTSGATNGSGVRTTTLTSDDVLSANGEVLLITATDNATSTVVGRTTTRPA